MNQYKVTVLGAGLAGCEAAWTAANAGVPVTLVEMKPGKRTPAHREDGFAELVCSNSLRANNVENAVGLLKEEMRRHADSGRTVFFSTHVLDVAERLCDEIGIIKRGRLIARGTLDELRHGGDSSLEEVFLELEDTGEAL